MYEWESLPRLKKQGINSRVPCPGKIMRLSQNLLDFGQFTCPKYASVGGNMTILSSKQEEKILDAFDRNPNSSLRSVAREHGTSATTISNFIVSNGYDLFDNEDTELYEKFCKWLDRNRKCNILWTDLALFTQKMLYNKHDNEIWELNKPYKLVNCTIKENFSINVLAGFIGNKVLGPYFIDGTEPNYLQVIKKFSEDIVYDVPLTYRINLYFQHDSTLPSYTKAGAEFLNKKFKKRWIGSDGPVPWPANTADLSPLDTNVWDKIKTHVYSSKPKNANELRQKIISAFSEITIDI
jgi:hypothetical protein